MTLLPKVRLSGARGTCPLRWPTETMVAKNIIVDADHNITGFGPPVPDA